MRLIVDSLIALMLVGVLAGVLLHYQQEQRQLGELRFVHQSLARLHKVTTYQTAMRRADHEMAPETEQAQPREAFPRQIAPAWFGEKLPLNVLVPIDHPWIDIAPPDDMSNHPPDPVIHRRDQAGFWYNPNRGVFRARVPSQFTPQDTLRLYNRVNGTALLSLANDGSAQRQPERNPIAPAAHQRRAAREASATGIDRAMDQVAQTVSTLLSTAPASAAAASASEAGDDGPAESRPDASSAPEPSATSGADHDADDDAKEDPAPTERERPTLLNTAKKRPDRRASR